MKNTATRQYVMTVRAESAAATKRRTLESAHRLLVAHSFEEMTVDMIAAGANTTARTVLRLFGSKEELLAQALHSLGQFGLARIAPDDVEALVNVTYDFYEKIGDTVIRWLADEPRIAALHEHLNIGRRHLRVWVAEGFASELGQLRRQCTTRTARRADRGFRRVYLEAFASRLRPFATRDASNDPSHHSRPHRRIQRWLTSCG